MSLSNALTNATSGLAVSARLADTIANNVANAMTEGFGRRTTEVTSLALGGYGSGARIGTTHRAESLFLTAQRRGADASTGAAGVRSDVLERLLASMGEPGASGALATRATALETALMGATAAPQSTTKLAEAVTAAKDLAAALNRIAEETARLRTEADTEIARQVDTVNAALVSVDGLNRKIRLLASQGIDVTGLQDERGRVIDGIAAIVPLRTVRRDGDEIALYSANGGALLDGRVFGLGFTRASNAVTAGMSIGAGLSPLSQERGAAGGPVLVEAGTGAGLFDGGSLGALFEARDRTLPEFGREIDAYAGDLIARFRDLMPPGARDAGGAGLFVDAGGATAGTAARIAVNSAVDPAEGGAVWRLRDGLADVAPGAVGDGTYLQALSDAMAAARSPVGLVSQDAAAGAATMAAEIGSFFAGHAERRDADTAFAIARQSALEEQELNETGVDSDAELETLVLIEQAYAANARVLSTIDDLMSLLLEI